jgi:hypothetical protein
VVYGHPYETVDADAKLKLVTDWYSAKSTQGCRDLLLAYPIKYVLVGPVDGGLDPTAPPYVETACVKILGTPVATFGTVSIYAAPKYF